MRRAEIYYKDNLAGILTETDDGEYVFQYQDSYLREHPEEFLNDRISIRMDPIPSL